MPGNDVLLSIGGAPTAAASGRTFDRHNPFTGKVVTTTAAAGADDARRAADAAAAALPAWSATTPSHRRQVLLRAAELLSARAEDLAAAMVEEIGAASVIAQRGAGLAADHIREAAAMTTLAAGQTLPTDRPGSLSMTVRKPMGVCLGIAPWNGPVVLGARAIAYPLAFGNTVVFKASEQSPRTHSLLARAFQDAGLPAGVLDVVHHSAVDGAEVTNALIEHPAVRHINFTGSSRVGRLIAESAARHHKRVLLELGGKSPLIVLDDADLDEAARAAALGAFTNQGQVCVSTERVIVHDSVADALLSRLGAHAMCMPAGDPSRPENILGSLVDEASAIRVERLVRDAVAAGAVLVAGGSRDGAVMPPTVLDRVTPDMEIYYEETFGPATVVIRVADDDEAVSVANDTDYGLSSAIFSADVTRALGLAARLDTGMCHINGPTVRDEPQAPFGGVKASGWGRFGGLPMIDEFTTLQWITVDDLPGHYPPFLADRPRREDVTAD
ncbi:aldehyde dehydrogenase [Kutzneria sp. NPDC052558]|uniref:aldehyde dehydrogenase n=1 Tax=Kutzneria sp. NPDC052558 TaxID=3364121 RepID=UPI0037CC4E96